VSTGAQTTERRPGDQDASSDARAKQQPTRAPGALRIADRVVSRIVTATASQVDGVHALGGGVERAVGAVMRRTPLAEHEPGVRVEVGEREAAADIRIVVAYGSSIPAVAQRLRERVFERVEAPTGLSVTEVNVSVADVFAPEPTDAPRGRRPR
jgi:uncharacterized alkaline shock family protein YloU